MSMPFFDAPDYKNHIPLLMGRMVALRQAIENKTIIEGDLKTISRFSTKNLNKQPLKLSDNDTSPNDALRKLYDVLKDAKAIDNIENGPLIDGLKRFDSEHGEYLPLLPLTVGNQQTLSLSLNDFALFYLIFIRHMSYQKKTGEVGDQYQFDFDLNAAGIDWLQWESERPARISFDPAKAGHPGIFEKFLAGELKKDEWLTDLDIKRELAILGLKNQVHVVPFNEDDIGLVLHFEREKHQQDQPKKPYVIPLIVNLGEDGHSRISSRGAHWTRMVVTVEPKDDNIPTITVNYADELFLHERDKKDIDKTIRNALEYRKELGGYAKDEQLKIYTAFPECDNPTIQVTGSGEQTDGFTCGYRALRGLVSDLIQQGVIEKKDIYQKLMDCADEKSLRDFVYRSLLGEQRVVPNAIGMEEERFNRLFSPASGSEESTLRPDLVEGQLLAFSPSSTMKKEGKRNRLNPEWLEQLVEQKKEMERLRNELEMSKKITAARDESMELSLETEEMSSNDPALVLKVIFEQLINNEKIEELKLTGTGKIDKRLLYENIESLPSRINLTSDDPNIQPFLEVIRARKKLLDNRAIHVPIGADPWDSLFDHLLFNPSLSPGKARFEWMKQDAPEDANAVAAMGVEGFRKLLQYTAAHEDRFIDGAFPFEAFDVSPYHDIVAFPDSNLGFLTALKEHLQSEEPFIPFKRFHFFIPDLAAIKKDELVQELDAILKAAKEMKPIGIEKLEITSNSLAGLSEETIQALIEITRENDYPTILSFSPKDQVSRSLLLNLQELENVGRNNQRLKSLPDEVLNNPSQIIKTKEPVVLGKIGKAILKTEGLEGLDTEVQIQEQQQQQVQQQIQTALDDEELPEEDELVEEAFAPYTGHETLLTRKDIGNDFFKAFVSARHPHLTPEDCWDLITGAHADLFKYGIKKMTVSAAKVLIEHIQDVQFGLHPDNLPRGFSLQEKDGDLVLAYTPFNPAINPNESPLTIRFSKPLLSTQWAGNALQFMDKTKAEKLHKIIIKNMRAPKPDLDTCISQFFFLKSDDVSLSVPQRVTILKSFIEERVGEEADAIQKQITDVFGDKLTLPNIKALSDVFYEQGPEGLSALLTALNEIKTIKGAYFFTSFKTCFIDPSQNLNELTTERARAAMQKLLTLSAAETAWWVSLTTQHTSNLYYQTESDDDFQIVQNPGQRWANLAELTEGFLYFCGELQEKYPGLNLTQYCPLTNVADMRVALDRLLTTVLPNAHNKDEQFYEGLEGLSLDPLGPFYASRYEGFKLVTPDMMLDLGRSYSNRPKDNKRYAEEDFSFRCDKFNIGGMIFNFLEERNDERAEDKIKSQLMRYIATFNHRAPQRVYLEAFSEILNSQGSSHHLNNLLVLIVVFGTGKRGKNFNQEDIKFLIGESQNEYLINMWATGIMALPVRPTIAEIAKINQLAFDTKDQKNFIYDVTTLIISYDVHAEKYIEALLLLEKNKQNLGAVSFQSILTQIERPETEQQKQIADGLTIETRVAIAKLLAVCRGEGDETEGLEKKALALYTEVKKCDSMQGVQTTRNLLELLGHIDVEKSEELPTLARLTELVETVAQKDKPDYNELERTVREALPNTVIQMDQVIAAPMESSGNLQTIITKYMGEIKSQLEDKKTLIDKQLGKGFFESLSSPEGPKALLNDLKLIADFSGFLGSVVQGEVRKVMLKVYDSVAQDGLGRFGLRDELIKSRLAKIINHKIHHSVKKESNFNAFSGLFASELDALNQYLSNLQRIHKTWPADFQGVLGALEASSYLDSYPLSLLAKLTEGLVENFNKNAPFPAELLQQFLAFENVTEGMTKALKDVVDVIFDKEPQKVLNEAEKRLLCELALRYCRDNTDASGAPAYINQLLSLRQADDGLFTGRLKLLLYSGEKVDNSTLKSMTEAFGLINQFNEPDQIAALDFFTVDKTRANNFVSVIGELGKIEDTNKQPGIFAIAFKAAQGDASEPDQGNMLCRVIDKLSSLEPSVLQQLESLYDSPRHPDLKSLDHLFSAGSPLDVDALQKEYDRDYWHTRGKDRNFDTSQLAEYLDKSSDLNYERPLLLSQREQLQRWFLMINAIGNNRGVAARPWTEDGGSCKPFKDMSHEEIQGLLEFYRTQLRDKEITPEKRLTVRLEAIALLREAMYRGTGNFPRATQILYLLTAMQNGQDFIAQIQTGQGKSLTAGLAAAMETIEGKTVDICTSSLFLANEGLEENQGFFDYLGLSAGLIHANSGKEAYQAGAIHYSSMAELALHRSKMQLQGKVFPKNCTLIADEVDFSTLDDSTRYRYATALDPVVDPYKSSYTWIYEALVQFVDAQKTPKNDEEFREQAKNWLRNSAKSKDEKTQLKELEVLPDVYRKRLETWLVAAGKTNQLVELEQVRFRVVTLEHKKYGQVSKACILSGGRPNIQAEFSDAIQQFLHVRLRQKYRNEIEQGQKPDFLVEPEKTYITTLNSKILLNNYKLRLGMSGTAGSREEIKEQYAKYGFRFVDIPPFTESKRDDLNPILTNPKLVNKPEAESRDHINRIVKETLHYLRKQKGELAGPVLIHCADKEQGEAIYQALEKEISKNPRKYQSRFLGSGNGIQRFYSSEKPTPDERNEEEKAIKKKAGLDGMITISTVFGRGTDIKPKHTNGLYTIDTFVDTEPYSSEDLERSKRQKIGRAGRAGQVGFSRLIVRRSEFSDVYSQKQMRKISQTKTGLDEAISELNQTRNKTRVAERESRESFDDIKEIIFQEFFKYIEKINDLGKDVPKKAILDRLKKQWNLVLSRIDECWEELQHAPELRGNLPGQLESVATFACEQWNKLAGEGGILRSELSAWSEHNELALSLPEIKFFDWQDVVETVTARKPCLERFLVKKAQQYDLVDPTVSEAAVYSDFMASPKPLPVTRDSVDRAKEEAIKDYIAKQVEWLSTPAHRQKLKNKFIINEPAEPSRQAEQIMGALLYLRYQAHRAGNPLAYARLSKECRGFESQMVWSTNDTLINAVVQAQKDHFNILTNHRGKREAQKIVYLNTIMSEGRKILPKEAHQWKKKNFSTWWNGDDTPKFSGMKAQAVNWLTAYKDKWWTRGWVSRDRKKVVATLLTSLQNEQQDPKNILDSIAKAREQLLNDDKQHARSLKSGIQGRLYHYLNELEHKIQAAMAPDELDASTDKTFDNIKIVLQQAESRGIKSKESGDAIDFLNKETATPLAKYRALSVFFDNAMRMNKPKGAASANWKAFQSYCQQAKLDMVYFFEQCDKNSVLNEQRSIQVYQAASQAAAIHLQHRMGQNFKSRLNLPPETFAYRDKEIAFQIKKSELLNKGVYSSLFTKINQEETYKELLVSLEQAIVENSPNDTQVQFTAVILNDSNYYSNQEGFKLTVKMHINGVPAQMDYHINLKTGEMHCNDQWLQKLDEPHPQEPELEGSTQEEVVREIQDNVNNITEQGEELTNQTQGFKEKLNQVKQKQNKSKEEQSESTKTNVWVR